MANMSRAFHIHTETFSARDAIAAVSPVGSTEGGLLVSSVSASPLPRTIFDWMLRKPHVWTVTVTYRIAQEPTA